MKTPLQIVGETIRKKRKERGMSQKELAVAAGKRSPAYIALIEVGERNIGINDLYKIAVSLQVPISSLFGELSEYGKGFADGRTKAITDVSVFLSKLSDK